MEHYTAQTSSRKAALLPDIAGDEESLHENVQQKVQVTCHPSVEGEHRQQALPYATDIR
jgi:hypothetical protein